MSNANVLLHLLEVTEDITNAAHKNTQMDAIHVGLIKAFVSVPQEKNENS